MFLKFPAYKLEVGSCCHIYERQNHRHKGKGPYTFVRRRVPVKEDTYPEPSACEVG